MSGAIFGLTFFLHDSRVLFISCICVYTYLCLCVFEFHTFHAPNSLRLWSCKGDPSKSELLWIPPLISSLLVFGAYIPPCSQPETALTGLGGMSWRGHTWSSLNVQSWVSLNSIASRTNTLTFFVCFMCISHTPALTSLHTFHSQTKTWPWYCRLLDPWYCRLLDPWFCRLLDPVWILSAPWPRSSLLFLV